MSDEHHYVRLPASSKNMRHILLALVEYRRGLRVFVEEAAELALFDDTIDEIASVISAVKYQEQVVAEKKKEPITTIQKAKDHDEIPY